MRLLALAMAVALSLFAQDPRATVRVEVTAAARPVDRASVTVNGAILITGPDGVATAPVPLGPVKIEVTREGFHPASASLSASEPRDYIVQVEMLPKETAEEEITVSATRNDVRLQDSPVRVEV